MPHRSFRALIAVLAFVLVAEAGALFSAAAEAAQGRAVFVQSYPWTVQNPRFGGFSAIDIDARGRAFVTLSDRATIWRGQILRDGQDRITGVTTSGPVPLKDGRGRPMARLAADSEGLALAPDGSVYMSFEMQARVDHYSRDDGPAAPLPRLLGFHRYDNNASFESLAIDRHGALYTMPEDSGGLTRPFPVWRYRDGQWTQPFSIPRDGTWLPVGSDFGPDGRFYLLERDFWTLLGFRNRVQVFDISGDKISGGEVLFETPAGRHDNLEGLTVWRDKSGAIRLTMISDDNFRAFQRTEIVEYRISH